AETGSFSVLRSAFTEGTSDGLESPEEQAGMKTMTVTRKRILTKARAMRRNVNTRKLILQDPVEDMSLTHRDVRLSQSDLAGFKSSASLFQSLQSPTTCVIVRAKKGLMRRYGGLGAAGCVVMVVGVIVLFLEPAEYFFGDSIAVLWGRPHSIGSLVKDFARLDGGHWYRPLSNSLPPFLLWPLFG